MEKEKTAAVLVIPAIILQQKLFIASEMEEETRNFISGYVMTSHWSIDRMSILTEMYSAASKLMRILEKVERRGTILAEETNDENYILVKDEALIIEICDISYSTCEQELAALSSKLITH